MQKKTANLVKHVDDFLEAWSAYCDAISHIIRGGKYHAENLDKLFTMCLEGIDRETIHFDFIVRRQFGVGSKEAAGWQYPIRVHLEEKPVRNVKDVLNFLDQIPTLTPEEEKVIEEEAKSNSAVSAGVLRFAKTYIKLAGPTTRRGFLSSVSEQRERIKNQATQFRRELLASPQNLKTSTKHSPIKRQNSSKPSEKIISGFIFRKQGEVWSITFQDKTTNYPDAIGFSYIHLLLREPKKSFPAFELIALCNLCESKNQHLNIENSQKNSASRKRRATGVPLDSITDLIGLQKIRERQRELIADLERARKNNNVTEIDRIQNELSILGENLGSVQGKGGRSRNFPTTIERSRQSVGHAIQRALEKIKTNHRELWIHLSKSIETGTTLSYNPDQNIPWITA